MSREVGTAAELWRAFVDEAGLSSRYDSDLEAELRRALGLPARPPLGRILDERAISVSELAEALLGALAPFGAMLADLLALYERIGARRADGDNLRIEYDFGRDVPPLAFDLRSFREEVERVRRVTARVAMTAWTMQDLFDLSRLLHEIDVPWTDADAWPPPRDAPRPWPEALPPLPMSSHPALDMQMARLWEVADQALALLARRVQNEDAMRSLQIATEPDRPEDRPDLTDGDLHGLWSDWLVPTVSHVRAIAAAVAQDSAAPWIEALAAALQAAIDRVPTVTRDVERMVRELFDLLSLPMWGRRHDLYSAWVFAALVEALGRDRVEVHTDEDTLRFPFGGSRVATVASAEGPLELWAEMRSPYATPIGRGRSDGVQPDYLLTRDSGGPPSGTLLVVECKQYLRPSPKTFGEALADYAGAHTTAHIVIASYGRGSPRTFGYVPSPLLPRTHLVEHLRPNQLEALVAFEKLVRAVVPPPPNPDQSYPVGLVWGPDAPSDLDLHAVVTASGGRTVVNWQGLGTTDGPPWVSLYDDDQGPRGFEIMFVSRFAGDVELSVHAYSVDRPLAASNAAVYVNGEEFLCPTAGDGRWWHVARIGADRRVTVRGWIDDVAP